MKRIVIIGGGVSGLAAAHRLKELASHAPQPFETVLLEASPRLGGIIDTAEREGFLLELGPDSFISEKPEALNLARRLGLAEQLIETNPTNRRSLIVAGGRLRPVPEGFYLLAPSRLWPFLNSDIFSWPGKGRILLDLVLPRRATNGSLDESLASFVRRRLGQEALERMAQPMIGGIFTADPENLSLRASFPRFLEMERDHRSLIMALRRQIGKRTVNGPIASGARYNLFLSFIRGMRSLVDRLSSQLPETTVLLGSPVEQVILDRRSQQWSVILASNRNLLADALCLALPAPTAAALLKNTDPKLAAELEGIRYESTATINLAYRRTDIAHALDGFGFVVPAIEKRSLIACTFSSVKFSGRAPAGYVLLRAFVGGALQPEMFDLDADEIVSRVEHDLRELLGVRGPARFAEVSKWQKSMPQYHVGHLSRLERINARLADCPNLWLAGSGYSGAGIPDCVRTGEIAAAEMLASLNLPGNNNSNGGVDSSLRIGIEASRRP
ncbi:MAG TPA: protoporphyrinogen oxidase [Pyrinomonadaceae bacterium]|nr:protoporphyrinogen oxidase [Pyrinomonadaceae bacterium]